MKKIFLIVFLLVSAGELYSQVVETEWLHHLCKPLILLSLGGYYWFSLERSLRSMIIVAAIVFSFLGDSFLMYEALNPLYFMLGLASFLVAHIFYSMGYARHMNMGEHNQLQKVQKVRMSFPVILAGTGLVVVLYPSLGELRIPVIIYALVLMIMVLNAIFRYHRTTSKSFWLVSVGAVFFMISDSVLAINRFLNPVTGAGIIIMTTYIAAQYLIIEGLIDHQQKSKKSVY